jgi:ABC-type antimicrobial peptide transport system permease subunit
MVYVPYWWRARTATSLVIKTAADPAAYVPAVRGAVRAVDPEIAVGRTRALDELVDGALAGRRYQVQLFVAFGIAALTIAIIGVYAVTSYGVSRRRREMNIRLALGAAPTEVVAMIVRQGFVPVAFGLGGGAVGAIAVGALVASLLFDVRARDPIVIAVVVSVVGVVGLLACVAAARQGLSLSPAAALREE